MKIKPERKILRVIWEEMEREEREEKEKKEGEPRENRFSQAIRTIDLHSLTELQHDIIFSRLNVGMIRLKLDYLRKELRIVIKRVSPVLRRLCERRLESFDKLEKVLESLSDVLTLNMSKEDYEEISSGLRNIFQSLQTIESELREEYTITENEETGDIEIIEYKSLFPQEGTETPGLNDLQKAISPYTKGSPWGELKKVSQAPKPKLIRMSKDQVETLTHSVGDTLEYIQDPKRREEIRKLNAEGKLLSGTLEGLSGGTPYLKSFTIALAQTLNEQSKYYNTEKDNTGVPKDLIPSLFGDSVEVKKEEDSIPVKYPKGGEVEVKHEKRKHPYILVSYEDLASKLRPEGKKRGGKDAIVVRDYIEALSGKVYLLDGGKDNRGKQILIGVPFLVRELFIYRGGKEVGCLLRLNPQFSRTLRGYSGVRADSIPKMGGGKQKPITMSLFDRLIYVRGVNTDNVWKKNKDRLLSEIATSERYKTHPKDLDNDFRVAIEKMKLAELVIGYREEKTPGGETLSVFTFNPHYSKGEEDSPDVQTGE